MRLAKALLTDLLMFEKMFVIDLVRADGLVNSVT